MPKHSPAYLDYLASDAWQLLRSRIISARGRYCEHCSQFVPRHQPIQLHHKHYRTLGKERDEDLELLCVPCHDLADAQRKRATAGARKVRSVLKRVATFFSRKKKRARSPHKRKKFTRLY